MGKILVLCPFPLGRAASQRFRFEQYVDAWRRDGWAVDIEPFWDERTAAILYAKGFFLGKALGFGAAVARRLRAVVAHGRYDWVFVHLGAIPVGPPVIEALCKLRGFRMVFDIDDAIFLGHASKANPVARFLRSRSYVEYVTRRADRVVVVNPYLEGWAKRFNDDVRLIPTTIDPTVHRPPPDGKPPAERPVIGWTGTFTTTVYLDIVRPALAALAKERDFTLRIICNADPGFSEVPHYDYVEWREDREVDDLWPIDIGLMPLTGATVGKGKVGLKAIQYGAVGIPTIASDEGSAREVIEDGVTGLVIGNSTAEWVEALRRLIDDPAVRARMGRAARERILPRYSVPSQEPAYLGLFRD